MDDRAPNPTTPPAVHSARASGRGPDGESLGRRIARLRGAAGMTQQELAARIAISRVALSNLESGRSVPGERTVTLLAGIFGTEPWDLVEGTGYPSAKADRLPAVTARHTEVELQLALLDRDLRWLETATPAMARDVVARWRRSLVELDSTVFDDRQRSLLRAAIAQLAAL